MHRGTAVVERLRREVFIHDELTVLFSRSIHEKIAFLPQARRGGFAATDRNLRGVSSVVTRVSASWSRHEVFAVTIRLVIYLSLSLVAHGSISFCLLPPLGGVLLLDEQVITLFFTVHIIVIRA